MLEGVGLVLLVDLFVCFLGAGVDDAQGEAAGLDGGLAGMELAGEDAEGIEFEACERAVVDDFGGVHALDPLRMACDGGSANRPPAEQFTAERTAMQGFCLGFW